MTDPIAEADRTDEVDGTDEADEKTTEIDVSSLRQPPAPQ